jgi:hypothetical protein
VAQVDSACCCLGIEPASLPGTESRLNSSLLQGRLGWHSQKSTIRDLNRRERISAGTVAWEPNTILATGGRHVEFGLALAQGKRMIMVGPRENVFHYLLPDSQIFATWNKAFATIRRQHTLCQETLQRQTKAVAKVPP